MKKNRIFICLLLIFASSCSTSSLTSLNTDLKNITDKNLVDDKSSKSTDSMKTQLISEPDKNIEPTPNKLVSEPDKNLDPTKLIAEPDVNIDPNKAVEISNTDGESDIKFNQGKNEINFKINFTEFQILSFNILSTIADDNETDHLELSIKMDNSEVQSVKIENKYFRGKNSINIKLSGLKDLDNLNVQLYAKDINNNTLANQILINEEVKGNKSINATFNRKVNSSNNQNNSSSNSNNSSNNQNNSSNSQSNSENNSSSNNQNNSSNGNGSNNGNSSGSQGQGNNSSNSQGNSGNSSQNSNSGNNNSSNGNKNENSSNKK